MMNIRSLSLNRVRSIFIIILLQFIFVFANAQTIGGIRPIDDLNNLFAIKDVVSEELIHELSQLNLMDLLTMKRTMHFKLLWH